MGGAGAGGGARVSEFFTKNPNLKKIDLGGLGGGINFLQRMQILKKNVFVVGRRGGEGGGGVEKVIFYKESKS